MAVANQVITDRYALYNGDCIEVMERLPGEFIHLSLYSPPFCGLYVYSSTERDLSNARSYEEFFTHYAFVVKELHRLTLPGRISAVHCMDVPGDGANLGGNSIDFPGDIIRLHQRLGWDWACRYMVWKEPLAVRNRTMAKSLAHRQIVEDSSLCENAAADQLLIFRKPGQNPIPIAHPRGLSEYLGAKTVPHELWKYRDWQGKQTENRLSHWIWRQYASAFWDDVRLDKVLPYKHARDNEDEKHMHPLQLDVIGRAIVLWSNPGEIVFTPFMGVGSEVYGAVRADRKGVGVELKPTYYNQAVKNLLAVDEPPAERLPLEFPDEEFTEIADLDFEPDATSEPTIGEPEPTLQPMPDMPGNGASPKRKGRKPRNAGAALPGL
jgi:DNA modification methylase